jgi:hypothetical protein
MNGRDDLDDWVLELCERLQWSKLLDQDPRMLGPEYAGFESLDQAVRVLLAELEYFDGLTPEEWQAPENRTRWRLLRGDLKRLRSLLT